MIRRRSLLAPVCLLACACLAQPAPDVSLETLLKEQIDFAWVAKPPQPKFRAHQITSHAVPGSTMAAGPRADAVRGNYLREQGTPSTREYVMADLKGPGAVVRLWSPNPSGRIWFYFDGETQSRMRAPTQQILSDEGVFGPPFAWVTSGGYSVTFPVPYEKSLKITYEGPDADEFIYAIGYRTYEPRAKARTFDWPEYAAQGENIVLFGRKHYFPRDLVDNVEARPLSGSIDVPAGETKTVMETIGSEAVFELRARITPPPRPRRVTWDDPAAPHNLLRNTILRVSFDGQLSILCPIGDFFGAPGGTQPFQCVPFERAQDGTLISRLVMPFAKSAKFEIENAGSDAVKVELSAIVGRREDFDKLDLDDDIARKVEGREHPPQGPIYHLRAQWTQDDRALDTRGEGYYFGTVAFAANSTTEPWAHGHQAITVDGERRPSFEGVQPLDLFNIGSAPTRSLRPLFGRHRLDGPGEFGYHALFRIHLTDPVPFSRSIRVDFGKSTADHTARTVFWYAKPGNPGPKAIDHAKLTIPQIARPKEAGVIEGERLGVARSTGGKFEIAGALAGASDFQALLWHGANAGENIALAFFVPKAGRYEVSVRFGEEPGGGRFKVSLANQELPDLDLHAAERRWSTRSFGALDLPEGNVILLITLVEPTEASRTRLTIDWLRLEPKS